MRLYLALLAGPRAMDAQPIFASSDPGLVAAVVDRLRADLDGAGAVVPPPGEQQLVVGKGGLDGVLEQES